jgi:hypothetical protein
MARAIVVAKNCGEDSRRARPLSVWSEKNKKYLKTRNFPEFSVDNFK